MNGDCQIHILATLKQRYDVTVIQQITVKLNISDFEMEGISLLWSVTGENILTPHSIHVAVPLQQFSIA